MNSLPLAPVRRVGLALAPACLLTPRNSVPLIFAPGAHAPSGARLQACEWIRCRSPQSVAWGSRSPLPACSSSGASRRCAAPARGRQKSPRCGRGGHTLVERSPTPFASPLSLPVGCSREAESASAACPRPARAVTATRGSDHAVGSVGLAAAEATHPERLARRIDVHEAHVHAAGRCPAKVPESRVAHAFGGKPDVSRLGRLEERSVEHDRYPTTGG